jgi:hypothetical protein
MKQGDNLLPLFFNFALNMPSGKFKKMRKNQNLMEHLNF